MQEFNNTNFKVGITHAGKFHADDVFASALLKILFPDIAIFRKAKIKDTDRTDDVIIFDTGGGKYDHHQPPMVKERREDGTAYAAFGKIWRDFGYMILPNKEDREYIDNILVKHIDNTDNGGSPNPLTSAIKAFNCNWDDTEKTQDMQFDRAVSFAKEILENYISKKQAENRADEILKKVLETQKGSILVLDKYIPINPNLTKNVLYVLYPSVDGTQCTIDAIMDINTQKAKMLIPARDWMVRPPKGMTYVNPKGYNARFISQETAINAAMSLVNADNFVDFDYISNYLKNHNYLLLDSNGVSTKVYGVLKMTNGAICPVLSVDKLYSLNRLHASTYGDLQLSNECFGMIEAGKETKDDRIQSYQVFPEMIMIADNNDS